MVSITNKIKNWLIDKITKVFIPKKAIKKVVKKAPKKIPSIPKIPKILKIPKKKSLPKAVKKKIKKAAAPKYRLEKGTTEFMEKKFIRFRFALWRYRLTDIEKIDLLFKRLQTKYKAIKSQGKKFPTQRIGITFAAQEKEYNVFTNSKTNRKNTTEVYDFISTATFANNDPSTVGMFEELKDKVIKYYLKTGKSPSMLDDDSVKTAKHFYVFFVEA